MDAGSTELISPLRFDTASHEYVDARTGEVLPSISSMLKRTGWIDDRFFTDEGRRRGSAVHKLTLDYDLEAISLENITGRYRGYLLGWATAMGILRPEWSHLEEPFIHAALRFGGTPDRVGLIYRELAVLEKKTGGHHRSHKVQTALQAILVGAEKRVAPESIARYCLYVNADGKFKVEQFTDLNDLREARKVLRQCIAA